MAAEGGGLQGQWKKRRRLVRRTRNQTSCLILLGTEDGIDKSQKTSWAPVEIEDHPLSPQGKGLELRIGNVAVEVRPDFDEKLLRDVVRVLSALC